MAEARKIFCNADSRLRALMEKALGAGDYRSVGKLAELANALGRVAGEASLKGSAPPTEGTRPSSPRPVLKAAASKPKSKSPIYPRFETYEGRLVKIGWSKRERAQYEHKASKQAALAVFMKLGNTSQGTPFRMEELLPVELPDGTEVPSYQSYLVLAWLRDIQHVEKRANDSYLWVADDASTLTFDAAWKSTSQRADSSRPTRQ